MFHGDFMDYDKIVIFPNYSDLKLEYVPDARAEGHTGPSLHSLMYNVLFRNSIYRDVIIILNLF